MKKSIFGLALWGAATLAAPALADVKIGIGTAVTGPHAAMGDQLKRGAEAAAADINAKGGVMGEKIVTTIGDDRSDPKEAVSVANKFMGEGVKMVVGHLTSGASQATAKEYEEGGIIAISPSATNPKLTDEGGWNLARTAGRDDIQGRVAGNYIAANFAGKKIAIVHDKGPYGKGLADEAKKALNAKNVNEVLFDGISPGEKDYSALVSKLKQLEADVLYYGGYYAEGGLIIRQLRDQGVKTLVIGGDGFYNDELATIAGDSVVGTLMTFTADPRKNPAAKSIVDAFKAKGAEPEGFTLYSYAAVQVYAQAAQNAKTFDAKKVSAEIRSGKVFDTVLGSLSFDAKGDLTAPNYVMYEWKKGADGKITYGEKAGI